MTRALRAFSAEVAAGSAQENATNKESKSRPILSAVVIALALLGAPVSAPAAVSDSATSATVPDDTFGEGGTRQSFSNDKHEVLAEVWRDRLGIVREQFEIGAGGAQLWGFFNGTGEGEPSAWRKSMIAVRAMDRPEGRFQMWIIAADDSVIKELSTLTRAELDTEFEYWHAQLRLWVNTARRRQMGEPALMPHLPN